MGYGGWGAVFIGARPSVSMLIRFGARIPLLIRFGARIPLSESNSRGHWNPEFAARGDFDSDYGSDRLHAHASPALLMVMA
jgi:hypothetical protein